MARIRKNLTYSDTRAEMRVYKDARRGASEDEFWDEDEMVDSRTPRKKKRRRVQGCEGNDGGSHVYVWVPWGYPESPYECKVCCGCEKSGSWRSFRVRAKS